ncbi:MAG: LD-carboxypeptidase [Prevotellaceae bacterium]|nr:LD-carboxypeptidase [Prevotellaceae bacterium]
MASFINSKQSITLGPVYKVYYRIMFHPHFLLNLLLFTLLLPAHARRQPLSPMWLQPGDSIAVISPSCPPEAEQIEPGMEILRQWGFRPGMGPNALKNYHSYAGTIDQRRSDLLQALCNPQVKAVICTRGGQGLAQLLYEIPLDTLRRYPKWVVGFSDITALLSAEVQAGIQSIHANMVEGIGRYPEQDSVNEVLHQLLLGHLPSYHQAPHPYNVYGKGQGLLVGGNMSVLGALADTPYDMLRQKDIILFIEDTGEGMYSVDRMFHQLMLRGVLKRVRGLIIGRFTDYKPDLGYASMEEMLHKVIERYAPDFDYPICFGFPAGHGSHRPNVPLLMGHCVTLSVSAQGTDLTF